MQAPKNGFFYVLDRRTGKLISAGKIGKVTWAEHIDLATGRPVEAKNIRYETGAVMIWPSPDRRTQLAVHVLQPEDRARLYPLHADRRAFLEGRAEPGDVGAGV